MISSILLNTISVVRQIGAMQLERFRSENLVIDTKFNNNDLVTDVDKTSEAMFLDYLSSRYPEHSVLSEEGGVAGTGTSGYRWVIDPLDGTANYAAGLPNFAVSVALFRDDEPVLGIVYAPYLNELFHAVTGEGAYLNGKPVKVSSCTSLADATVATGFPVDKNTNPDNNMDVLARMLPEVRAVRRLGSAAIDICYVAAGFLQGYWEMNLHTWDIAAGKIILEEAGGCMDSYREDRNISIIASTPALLPNIKKIITDET